MDRHLDMVPKNVCKMFQLDLLQAFQAKHQSKGVIGKIVCYNILYVRALMIEMRHPHIPNLISRALRQSIAQI